MHANHCTPGLCGSTAVNTPVVPIGFPVLCSENVVFIFLVHPFDVGDTLLLCTTGGGAARHDVSVASLLPALACLPACILRCVGETWSVGRAGTTSERAVCQCISTCAHHRWRRSTSTTRASWTRTHVRLGVVFYIDFSFSDRLQVEEIHLNYTRFLDKDNGRVWWPNRVLRDTPFINLSASGGCWLLPL